jgi:hypothetical protein
MALQPSSWPARPSERHVRERHSLSDSASAARLVAVEAFAVFRNAKFEFRIDMFNALNHTQFTGVNATANFASLTDPTITNLPYDASEPWCVQPTDSARSTASRRRARYSSSPASPSRRGEARPARQGDH